MQHQQYYQTYLSKEVHAHGEEEREAGGHLVNCQARLLRTPAGGGGKGHTLRGAAAAAAAAAVALQQQ